MELSLGELAKRLGAELRGDPEARVERVETLQHAGPGAVTFLSNRRYARFLASTGATAVILAGEDADACPVAAIVHPNPYLGYALAATALNPEPVPEPGIHPTAYVSPDAAVDPTASVGAHVAIDTGAVVEAGVTVGHGCVVQRDVTVGEGSRLVANVTLCAGTRVGRRALLHPGVVLGADGFGIANDDGVWVKVPQLGRVCLGDDVEVGANTTIDCGALEDTVIEDGVKIDNQVQIGHNCHIGAHTAIAGRTGIAGSARVGKRCTVGGAVSIAGHIEVADDVHLTATSGVSNSIAEPGVYSSGMPIQENKLWRRNVVRLRRLDEMMRRIKALEDRLD